MKQLDRLLLETPLDLNLVDVRLLAPGVLELRTRFRLVRLVLALLFGVPWVSLVATALHQGGWFWLLPVTLGPPLLTLSALFGFARQVRVIDSARKEFRCSYQLGPFSKLRCTPLPSHAELAIAELRSAGEGGSSIFFHAQLAEVPGFDFCVATKPAARDALAAQLAELLGYRLKHLSSPRLGPRSL